MPEVCNLEEDIIHTVSSRAACNRSIQFLLLEGVQVAARLRDHRRVARHMTMAPVPQVDFLGWPGVSC